MTNDDLPPLFSTADAAAGRAQKGHFVLQRLELAAIVISAVALEFSWSTESYNVAGFVGATLLAVALAARIVGRFTAYEKRWHHNRSTAEAVKALAWQYAVGGGRYPATMSDQEARTLLAQSVSELGIGEEELSEGSASTTTDRMSSLRRSQLEQRRRSYVEHRLLDQLDWYSGMAKTNKRATEFWSWTVIGLEALALAMAVARGFMWFEFDWTGVLGAIAAAGLAWHQAKQHSYLAASYLSASQIVATLTTRFEGSPTADEWPNLVEAAEEFFASEHALWLSRRTWP